jgi:hypothetical protein
MASAPSPKPGQLIPIVIGDACRGFLYRRRGAFEAFTIDEKSLGIFPDERSAVAALFPNPKERRSG